MLVTPEDSYRYEAVKG